MTASHCATPIVPVGRSTRRISDSAPSASANEPRLNAHSTASKDSSGNSSDAASITSARTQSSPASAAASRVRATMPSETSIPTASPVGPTRRAAGSSAPPAPQPTSSTRPPGPSSTICASRSPNGAWCEKAARS